MSHSTIMQVLLALVILVILYIITLVVLNIDAIVINQSNVVKPKETTVIIDGYAPVSYLSNRVFNTFNSHADNFKKIGRSVNSMGGSQFTYQFWIKIDDPNDSYFKDLIVLLKGDNKKYKIAFYDKDTNKKTEEKGPDTYLACPMIKFVDSYRHMRVSFNTINSPLTYVDINMNPEDTIIGRRNALSLLPLSWYLLTFIIEDNVSPQSYAENGINFRFWINDFPYQDTTPSSNGMLRNNTLKQNDGSLYLFPSSTDQGSFLKLGDVKYFNYSLTDDEIRSAYKNGPPTKTAADLKNNVSEPPYLTEFNKIDVYNY